MIEKQLALKPQDLVVILKVAVNPERAFTLTELSSELTMALSAVHGSVTRSEQARLLSRSAGSTRAMKSSVHEFVVHGAKYCFPGTLGSLTRGMPTGAAGPVLRSSFESLGPLAPVWTDPSGDSYGPGLVPLHTTVPAACRQDPRLYDVLTLLDALRVGAARERELALHALNERLA